MMIDKVLKGLIVEICYVYLDDIIIFSEDMDSREDKVKSVLDRLKKNGLQIKKKMLVHQSKINQQTMRQLRGFMGLANYYRKFIRNFSKIAVPLNRHLNNTDKNVLLSNEAQEAFEKLKQELTDMDNILSLPNYELPFVLETDTSD